MHRILGVAGLTGITLALVTGCGGGHGGRVGTPTRAASTPSGYTTDQLAAALLQQIPDYLPTGSPQSGAYRSLPAVQNVDQLQASAKLDRPECKAATRAFSGEKVVQNAPAALVSFSKGASQTLTETLLAMSPDQAAQQVRTRVPGSCRTFRVKANGKWATDHVVEAGAVNGLGEGSRTVGVTTTVAGTSVNTWYVVLRSRGYLATITLYGPDATRAEAESLARTAYDQAERVLP